MKFRLSLCMILCLLMFVGCASGTGSANPGDSSGSEIESGSSSQSESESQSESSVTLYPSHVESLGSDVIAGSNNGQEENGFFLSDLTVNDGKPFYAVKTLESVPGESDWATVRAAKLGVYKWKNNGYEPDVYAQLVFCEGEGFYLRMTCFEVDPHYEATEYLGSVWNDSCMEFFADWYGEGNYTNIEVNAYGASYQGYGVSMQNRIKLPEPLAEVDAEILSDRWIINVFIPLDGLMAVADKTEDVFCEGYVFTGNFYKCGSDCEYPHYGMWSEIENKDANFHLSEFFGYFYIM